MATTLTITQQNALSGFKTLAEYLQKGFRAEVRLVRAKKSKAIDPELKKAVEEYKKFMQMVEELMEKEGIKFEKPDPEEVYKSMEENREFFEQLEKELGKEGRYIKV